MIFPPLQLRPNGKIITYLKDNFGIETLEGVQRSIERLHKEKTYEEKVADGAKQKRTILKNKTAIDVYKDIIKNYIKFGGDNTKTINFIEKNYPELTEIEE